jgi:hypothetical protein
MASCVPNTFLHTGHVSAAVIDVHRWSGDLYDASAALSSASVCAQTRHTHDQRERQSGR